ncbi:patatin-like phospholipase family protein [Saccharomonospora azurea]|uniref:patatin-like phospholipase family protein n=1 Tax=Saccharomonospora azurea TaxID=40988 RepID=UPI002409B2FC|nr:patatin-like phospholipase family protein [Saccharomonospora azurea]
MTLSYILGGGISSDPGVGTELCERYPAMRRSYEDIAGWTGLSVEDLLGTGDAEVLPQVQQAALQFGTYDVLAGLGVYPDVIGGVSLGGLVSASLAGAVTRQELFDYLQSFVDAPGLGADAEPEAVAFAMVPEGLPREMYHGPQHEGVYVAGEFGRSADGMLTVLMLSGLRSALETVRDQVPENTLILLDGDRAVHSPLRAPVSEYLEDKLAAMSFTDPKLPLCSWLTQGTLTSAEQVRDEFRRNLTSTVSLADVCAEMKQTYKTRLGLVLGSTLAEGFLDFTFPVAHLTTEAHVVAATTRIFEMGIELPTAH